MSRWINTHIALKLKPVSPSVPFGKFAVPPAPCWEESLVLFTENPTSRIRSIFRLFMALGPSPTMERHVVPSGGAGKAGTVFSLLSTCANPAPTNRSKIPTSREALLIIISIRMKCTHLNESD